MSIRDDTKRWSRLSIWDSFTKRERIKVAISRHGENLTDCFNTFQVSVCLDIINLWERGGAEITIQILTMIRVANFVDRADASALPGPSTSTAPQVDGEGSQETFDDAVRNLLPRVVFYNNDDFL